MDTAYLLLVGGVHLQWFGPGDGCSANVLYQKHHSGSVDRCQGAVILVGFGPDGSLIKYSLVTVQIIFYRNIYPRVHRYRQRVVLSACAERGSEYCSHSAYRRVGDRMRDRMPSLCNRCRHWSAAQNRVSSYRRYDRERYHWCLERKRNGRCLKVRHLLVPNLQHASCRLLGLWETNLNG